MIIAIQSTRVIAHPPRETRVGSAILAIGLLVGLVAGSPREAIAQRASGDARWAAVGRALGRTGETEDGYYRVTFPRRDLTVRIGAHRLVPGFELTSYFAFVPVSSGRVMAMGELVLREDEVQAVMEEARRQGIEIPALHNHLIGESPRILYAHVMATGEPAAVGEKLRALLARTAPPAGNLPAGRERREVFLDCRERGAWPAGRGRR